jgi:hypothetical protein
MNSASSPQTRALANGACANGRLKIASDRPKSASQIGNPARDSSRNRPNGHANAELKPII